MTGPCVLVVMGVSGAGKSTVAAALAASLGWPFKEGDELHPPSNVRKMHAGSPLTDDDRAPWLAAVKRWIDARLDSHESGVVTCSALKRAYRTLLVGGRNDVRIVYLHADKAIIEARLRARAGHFMPADLLGSQWRTLEEPGADERAITVDVADGVDAAVGSILRWLRAA